MSQAVNTSRFPNPLAERPLPQWFVDAKLGIFVHGGIHSVPGWAPLEEYAESNFAELRLAPRSAVRVSSGGTA
jgi:hypothetical protein